MIFEAPIQEANDIISIEVLKKLDGKEVNVPLVDTPGATEPKNIIGVCKRLFCRDDKLWAEFELFDQDISVGFSLKKPEPEIIEAVYFKEPSVPAPRNIDYAKD